MDPDIARWVLDYLVRQPLNDSTLAALLGTVPLSHTDTNFTKLLFLKKIESEISNGLISDNILVLLEQIEELEYRDRVEIIDSMKRAYCAVAVHCTVRFLEEDGMDNYFEAVKKIWRNRVAYMLKFENVGLISDDLISWKDEIETAVWDDNVGKVLLGRWKGLDVAGIVGVYVEEAKKKMGPSFLELVAETLDEEKLRKVFGVDKEDIHKVNVQHRSKRIAVKQSTKFKARTTRGVRIVDNDDPSPLSSQNKYGCMSALEVTKLQNDLRTSTSILKEVVKDPLPDALCMAKSVASNKDSVDRSNKTSNRGDEGSNIQTNATKAGLMTRNNTARTYEWDDSSDDSAGAARGPKLPTPKKRAVSPLKKYEAEPFRRKRKFWSNLEEDTLRTGVMKYGIGNWKLILNMYRDIFDERTDVDLKDKWRNMIK